MPTFLKSALHRGALIGASLLDTGVATLRGLVKQAPAAGPAKPVAPAAEQPAPPAGTRSRISNPKAARKVRARQ